MAFESGRHGYGLANLNMPTTIAKRRMNVSTNMSDSFLEYNKKEFEQ